MAEHADEIDQVVARPWEWRKASGGWTLPTDCGPRGRAFHAYDVNHNAACKDGLGLVATCEEPNEGSHFCPDCMEHVRLHPEGREKRVYRSAPGEFFGRTAEVDRG